LTGFLTFVLLLCPQYMVYQRIVPAPKAFVWAAVLGAMAASLIVVVVRRYGIRRIRFVTLIPLAGLLFFLMTLNGNLLDLNYSARPLAREIKQAAPDVSTVAVYDVRRDLDYGLAFYRNQNVVHYTSDGKALDGIPEQEHVLVIPTREADELDVWLRGRVYQQLFLYPTQGLSVYRVYPKS